MDDLKNRQGKVLGCIVETYIRTISPVGSKLVAQSFKQEVSPATIRNEMHDLETQEFITHPHTSAGRVPTDKGYRYYVDRLMPESKISASDVHLIEKECQHRVENVETLIERTSRILSTLSAQAGIVSFPIFEELVLRRVELTALGRQCILVVWVTENGLIQDRVVDMKEEIPELELKRLSHFLNQELCGMFLSDINAYLIQKLEHAHDSLHELYETARQVVLNSFPEMPSQRFHLEGSHNILEQPEFQDWGKSRQLFKTLSEKKVLADLIGLNQKNSQIDIQIGAEHQCGEMWDCSFVTAPYFVRDRFVGRLGILGPRRMSYGRAVTLVNFMAARLGEILEEW
jgi:heat-inducible transcriptional repressor